MTLCIAAKYDGGVLCATDTAVTTAETRFHTPTIKGSPRWDGFVMYAGEPWLCHEVIWNAESITLREVILNAAEKYKDEEGHPAFPAEFLQVTGGEIYLHGQGDVFGPYEYACIGSGGTIGWPVLDVLYKRIRSRTLGATRACIAEVMRATEKYDTTVYRPFLFHGFE